MSIIAEVKCARCDRKYSGMRGRCPYCGARRIGRGKYSEESDNSKGKMLVGVLILAVLVVAAGVLLFTSDPKDQNVETPRNSGTETPRSPSIPDETDVEGLPGKTTITPNEETTPPEEETPEQTTTPPSEVISVVITYSNVTKTDFTAGIGERVPLRVRIEPVGLDLDIVWSSSDESIFSVVATNTEGTSATVTGIGRGTGLLTVTVGGVTAECIVRIS